MDDPRKYKRIAVNLPCHFRHADNPDSFPATMLNISFGGMCLVSRKEFPPGAILEIPHNNFPCCSASNASSKCRIVFAQRASGAHGGTQFGLAFENSDEDFIKKLLQWVQLQVFATNKANDRITRHRQAR